jgi:hypothetical protein
MNNILVKEQFGFRKESSTEMAMYNLLNNILTSLDKKKKLCGWFILQLTKGFQLCQPQCAFGKNELLWNLGYIK